MPGRGRLGLPQPPFRIDLGLVGKVSDRPHHKEPILKDSEVTCSFVFKGHQLEKGVQSLTMHSDFRKAVRYLPSRVSLCFVCLVVWFVFF